jgi:hypothetical protein
MKKLIFTLSVLFLILFFNQAINCGQWDFTNGPYGGYTYALMTKGSNVYAGTFGGVFKSTDNGTSWSARINGFTNFQIYSLAGKGDTLFAGLYFSGGIYVSTNDGINWGFSGLSNLNVFGIAFSGSNVFNY